MWGREAASEDVADAAAQKRDEEDVRGLLLEHASALLDELQDKSGEPLKSIVADDLRHALVVLKVAQDDVEKIERVLRVTFPTKGPTPRELIAFIRFGPRAIERAREFLHRPRPRWPPS